MPASPSGRFAFGADEPAPGAFSVDRLMDFLTTLGQDLEIIVRLTRKPHGEVSVVA